MLHIEEPLRAEWEISALAIKLEKAHRFPLLIFHNVIVDGERATMPLTTFLMASRSAWRGPWVRRWRKPASPAMNGSKRGNDRWSSRCQAPVKQVVEKGTDMTSAVFRRCAIAAWIPELITEGQFLRFNRNTGVDNSAMHRGWLADRDEVRIWFAPNSHNAHNLRYCEEAGEDTPWRTGSVIIRWRCSERQITRAGREPLRNCRRHLGAPLRWCLRKLSAINSRCRRMRKS